MFTLAEANPWAEGSAMGALEAILQDLYNFLFNGQYFSKEP